MDKSKLARFLAHGEYSKTLEFLSLLSTRHILMQLVLLFSP